MAQDLSFIKVFTHDPVILKLNGSLYVYNSKYTSYTLYNVKSIQAEKRDRWKHRYITLSNTIVLRSSVDNSGNISIAKAIDGLAVFHYVTGSHKYTKYTLYIVIQVQHGLHDEVKLNNGFLTIENGKLLNVMEGKENIDQYINDIRVQELMEKWKIEYDALISSYDEDLIRVVAYVL